MTFPKPSPKARWVERTHIADVLAQLEPGTTLAARLNLMRWTGMRPSQMGRLTPEDFVLDHSDKIPHVIVPRGKGGKDALVPLVEEGIAAAREFIALDAYGPWSTAKAGNKALAKAAHKAGREAFTTYPRSVTVSRRRCVQPVQTLLTSSTCMGIPIRRRRWSMRRR